MYLAANEAAAAVYTPNGRVLEVGERLVQADYGTTLRKIAEGGADAFHEGRSHGLSPPTSRRTAASSPTRTCATSARPSCRPSKAGIAGTGCGRAPPGLGPTIIELFQILDGYDLAALGWNSPRYLDLISRAMQIAFKDR